ncbi:MAG: hypothetical protein QOK24_2715 [Verrucomicrobiota bacterium]|jgi:hypothetical protein
MPASTPTKEKAPRASKRAYESSAPVVPIKGADLDAIALRWAGIGPYYAMMPRSFAVAQIRRFTKKDELVLDPFCGRGTVPFAAAALGRCTLGIEIFPVGWVYAAAKCAPANRVDVQARLEAIAKLKPKHIERSEFFRMAYCPTVLRFLCVAREQLDWRHDEVDRTLMAFIMVVLHDRLKAGLSNQLRQTKAVYPDYAIRWWTANRMTVPPELDPVQTMKAKITWRYAKGKPTFAGARSVLLGDCTALLAQSTEPKSVKLLLTSPPYFEVTNYYIDQWLRNWMLGGPPRPCSGRHKYMKRFRSKDVYVALVKKAFTAAKPLLRDDAVIVVRTDARKFTFDTTKTVLSEVFPQKRLRVTKAPLRGPNQTALFGDNGTTPPGEVDIVAR